MKKSLLCMLLALLFSANAARAQHQIPILNPSPVAGDKFGAAVAADGEYLVVGVPQANLEAPEAGMAYLMAKDPQGGFAVLFSFQNPEPDSGDHFGAAVAIAQNHILIGAPDDDSQAPDAGSAYLFDASNGTLIVKLDNPAAFPGDRFGHAVATYFGKQFLIGAPHAISVITGATWSGMAYLFEPFSSNAPQVFFSPNPRHEDLFGWSVAFAGTNILIGAPGDDSGADNAGAAYLFENGSAALLHTFTSPFVTAADGTTGNFGISVASRGEDVIVGAPFDIAHTHNNADMGAAYVFNGSTYELALAIPRPDELAHTFGLTVAAFNTDILVGAPWRGGALGGTADAGAVYRFEGYTGTLLGILAKAEPEPAGMLGAAIAAAGNCIFAGAPGEDIADLADAGAVHAFKIEDQPFLACLELPYRAGLTDAIVEIPILVSSDLAYGFAQFVIDYNSTVLKFLGAGAGSAAPDFKLLVRENLPFLPETPETDRNVLVQISSAKQSFTGQQQEVVVLRMRITGSLGQKSPVAFDPYIDRTSLTTVEGRDINNGLLKLIHGRVSVGNLFSVSGFVNYVETWQPVPGADITLAQDENLFQGFTGTTGEYSIWDVPEGEVKITPSKYDDLGNSITGADALKTLRAVAFLDSLSEGQALAADVDLTGEVTGADALSLLRYLAFFPHHTALTGNWLFLPGETAFHLHADTAANFGAVVLGDVNLNWFSIAGETKASAKMPQLAQNGSSSLAKIQLPALAAGAIPADNVVLLPIKISTDSALGFAQIVVDYDGAVLQLLEVRPGKDASGFNLQVNEELPFVPANPHTNKNVLVQISSIGKNIRGNEREVAVLKMRVRDRNQSSPLAVDAAPAHTSLTTVHNTEIRGAALTLVNGHVGRTTAVNEQHDAGSLPQNFELAQNYPNPFNPETQIAYAVPAHAGSRVQVTLQVYNTQGQLVRTLVDAEQAPGRYQARWDGKDAAGLKATSGIYFYLLHAGNFQAAQKMLMLK